MYTHIITSYYIMILVYHYMVELYFTILLYVYVYV